MSKTTEYNVYAYSSSQNLLQAASDGAAFSIKLVASIMVNMMAFVSILNLINTTLVWIGERAGVPGMTFDVSQTLDFSNLGHRSKVE